MLAEYYKKINKSFQESLPKSTKIFLKKKRQKVPICS